MFKHSRVKLYNGLNIYYLHFLLQVLFWVYGGGFQIGSSKNYDGSVLASLHDVVVVVPNYRVNIFGFLSMAGGADSPCKGNMGLLDQAMALK